MKKVFGTDTVYLIAVISFSHCRAKEMDSSCPSSAPFKNFNKEKVPRFGRWRGNALRIGAVTMLLTANAVCQTVTPRFEQRYDCLSKSALINFIKHL